MLMDKKLFSNYLSDKLIPIHKSPCKPSSILKFFLSLIIQLFYNYKLQTKYFSHFSFKK